MKNYLVSYYDNTRQYYGQYFNHKEISAWSGVVLYVLYCQLVIKIEFPKSNILISFVATTLFILLVVLVVYIYIQNQLKMKDVAGAHAAAATFLLAEIIQLDEEDINVEHYMGVEESSDTQGKSWHVLPVVLLKKTEVINKRGRKLQDKTRWMVYSLLFLSTLLTVSFLWLNNFM
jgi:hypothetical protein